MAADAAAGLNNRPTAGCVQDAHHCNAAAAVRSSNVPGRGGLALADHPTDQDACTALRVIADPWSLRFYDASLEARYQRHAALWCLDHSDLPFAVMLLGCAFVGLAYTAHKGMHDCIRGITGASFLVCAVWCIVCLHMRRNSWLRQHRTLLVVLCRVAESAVFAGLSNKCRTFWDESPKRFLQSLLWDTGATHLLMSACLKPLPLQHWHLPLALLSWLVYSWQLVGPWCSRYRTSFYEPLLKQLFMWLTPWTAGVVLEPASLDLLPEPACCCVAVVLLVQFAVGLLAPMLLCHALDYALRRHFIESADVEGQMLPWPWAVEVCAGVMAYTLAWVVVVITLGSLDPGSVDGAASCPRQLG